MAASPSATLAGSNFRRFLVVGALVNSGRFVEMVLLGWVVAELTDSVWLVALAGFFRNAPMLVVSVVAGEIADRLGRRRLALFSEALAAVVCLGVGLLLLTGQRWFPYLAAGALLFGVSYAIEYPMRRALVADLVGRSILLRAISLEILIYNGTRVVGPLLGGAMLKLFDPAYGYLLLALMYGLAWWLFRAVVVPPTERSTGPTVSGGSESLRFLRTSPALLGVLGVTVTMNVLVFPHQSLLPVFARDTLRVDAIGLGWLAASTGIGSVIGSALLARLPALPQGKTFLASAISTAALVVCFALSGDFWLASGALLLSGLTQAGFSTMQSATMLHTAPAALRGRIAGWLSVAIGCGPFGVLAVGAVATDLGAPLAVALTAGLALLMLVAQTALARSLRRYRWGDA